MRIFARCLLVTLCAAGPVYAQESPDQDMEPAADESAEAEDRTQAGGETTDGKGGGAEAEPTPEEVERAGKHFERGLELYEEGEYALALIEFERAYSLVPDYRVQYNIGQVSIQVGRYANALKALQQYLGEGDDLIPEERRTEVERDVDMLKGRTATMAITSNVEGAEIVVDDLVIGTTPMSEPALVDAGVHRIEVRHKDYQTKREQITLAGGDSIDLSFDLEAVEKPEVVVIEKPGERQTTPGPMTPQDRQDFTVPAIAWVTTGALAIGAGVSGALGLAAKSELDQQNRSEDSTQSDREVAKERAENRFLAADILTAAAVVAGGISLYLTLSSDDSEDPEADAGAKEDARLKAVIGPGQVGVWGSF